MIKGSASEKNKLGIVWPLLMLTFYWQTRFPLCCQGQVTDYLIPFVYLSDLLIWVVLGKTLADYLKNSFSGSFWIKKNWRILFPPTFLIFVLMFLNIRATHQLAAWYKWFKLLEMWLFAVVVGSEKKVREVLWRGLSLGLLPVVFIAWGEVLRQRSLGLQWLGEWRFSLLQPGIAKVVLLGRELMRPYATFPHPNVLGGVLSLFAVVNLWRFLEELRSPEGAVSRSALLFFWLFSSVVLISFSRSAWLAYAVMLGATFGLWRKDLSLAFERLGVFQPFVVGGVVLALLVAPLHFSSITTTDLLSYERRVQLNYAAVGMIRKHPLFGVGLNNFVPALESFVRVTGQGRFLQPVHNVPLLIAAEIGLPLTLLATFYFLFLLLKLWQRRVYLLLVLWLGIMVTTSLDHYWFTLQQGMLTLALTLGLSMSSISRDFTLSVDHD